MKQTIFKRRIDGKLFYLWLIDSQRAEFKSSVYDDLDTERYFMDEVIRNHNEFEFIDGEQEINHCWTAKLGNEIVRVNNYGELIPNPRIEEGRFYFMNGKKNRIDSIGSWDEDAKAYRVMYGGKKGGCAFDTDFWVKSEQ